ncbi:hypothetical protein LPJ61_001006 [Coemansia biformis]|uniref:Uncharacterized protein n=1 Tax=Coemansia biformis TaxID=1286918 RepID=A0A9W7YHS3_9FUNG|nr:hypothetical protein LPJ61_001006 [Coemansia biformis]
MSMDSGDEAAAPADDGDGDGGEEEEEEAAAERMTTRQDTNPGRRRALQRLMAAIREGEFDTDVSGSEPESKAAPATRTKATRRSRRRSTRSQRAKVREGNGSDSDYVQNADQEDEDDGVRAEESDAADELELLADDRLKKTEKKLILKFKKAGRDKAAAGAGSGSTTTTNGATSSELRLEDIDWSEFDLKSINEILARREALRKRRRKDAMAAADEAGDGEITTAKLKKSSLAPPPLLLERVRGQASAGQAVARRDEREEGEEEGAIGEEGGETFLGDDEAMDIEGEEPVAFVGLFDDGAEAAPAASGSLLHLPPRALPVSSEDLAQDGAYEAGVASRPARLGRPHPALIRNMADRHLGADKDMRIVLQYELQQEETLLKDLQAEIVDKLLKLQAEERLLRLIVKKDFELPDDAHVDETAAMDTAYGGLNDADMNVLQGALDTLHSMDVDQANDSGSESDSSLSGMSSGSGSSDDDVQDEELTRGALSRMLRGFKSNGGQADDDSSGASDGS